MADYTIKRLEEVSDVLGDYPGEMRMMTRDLEAEQVAFTYRRMPQHTGGKGSYGHRHKEQEEIYFVASGKLQFKLNDEVVELGGGTAVRVPPQTWRSVWNDEPEDAELIIVSKTVPGGSRDDAEYLEDFTPALGSAIIGGFLPFPATNVHDELHARCLVLDDGKTKRALVVLDLLGIHYNVSREARKFIEQETGIPATNVLISAIHNHSAASALGKNHFEFPQKVDEYQIDKYQAFVARRIADGVKCAVNRLRPAQLAFTTAQAPEHVFNRRWFLKPGTMPPNPFGGIDQMKMNPAAGSPDLVKPAGPTDPTVSILAVVDGSLNDQSYRIHQSLLAIRAVAGAVHHLLQSG